MNKVFYGLAGAFIVASGLAAAQNPRPATKNPQSSSRHPQSKPSGTLAQIMRGIYFPNSNIIFDVQKVDPAAPKPAAAGGGAATDAYAGVYGGWERVENAAIALTDAVDLLTTPGRVCQNGKPVPSQRADYKKFADEMRKAGLKVL